MSVITDAIEAAEAFTAHQANEAETFTRELPDRARPGGDWLLDAPDVAPAWWGSGGQVLGAEGEALILAGPEGVGKTTLAQQLALARIGLREPKLLGLPVKVGGRVAYIALDRPSQARRSMRRMVRPEDRELLNEWLVFWAGPMPVNVIADPLSLLVFLKQLGVEPGDLVIVDSLKDAVLGIAKDEAGSAWNMARQHVLAEGVELVELHHQRKAQQNASAPRQLDDVYGSRWITAGSGSVLMLWGRAGDLVIEAHHLKQPAQEVGPFRILHDHERGRSTILGAVDLAVLVSTTPQGVTAPDVARLLFDTTTPDANQIEKARRRLRALVRDGIAVEVIGEVPKRGGAAPVRFVARMREAVA